jgi:hypothetical protein
MPLTRRAILALASCSFLPRPAVSAVFAATVTKASGPVTASLPDGSELALTTGTGLPAGARLGTGDTLVELALADGTRLNAGRDTTLALAADQTATASTASTSSISISGIAVVDRRGTGVATSLTVTSDGFDILLADSRVFLDSLARPAVLVQAGSARVKRGSEEIILASGEGIDIPLPDPSALLPVPARWAPARVAEAFASVGLEV